MKQINFIQPSKFNMYKARVLLTFMYHAEYAKKNPGQFSVFIWHLIVICAMILSKVLLYLKDVSTIFSVTYSLILTIALFEQIFLTTRSYKRFMEKPLK